MKRIFFILFVSIVTFSCSNESYELQSVELTGVWEQIDNDANSTKVYRLVFGSDQTGLKIYTITSDTGEVNSSASAFSWKINDTVITLSENEVTKKIYVINSEENVFLMTEENLRLDKISDDYSQYY